MKLSISLRLAIFAVLAVAVGYGSVAWYARQPKPLFARVTFGTDENQAVWFVATGADIYLDRDPNDGIQLAEYLGQSKVDLPFEFQGTDGITNYRNISVGLQLAPESLGGQLQQKLFFDVDIVGTAKFRQSGLVEMSDQVEDAATLHVDGILELHVPEQSLPARLVAGGDAAEVRVEVITIHADSRCSISVDTSADFADPENPNSGIDVPFVEFKFPSRNAAVIPAERFQLDELC